MKVIELLTQTIAEDWGSSDWYGVMQDMNRLLDDHFDGKRTNANIEAAARDIAPSYHDDIGHEDLESTEAAIVRMYKIRNKDKLAEAKGGAEYWTIHNMSGVPKKFKQIDGVWEKPTEAKAWMKSYGDPAYDKKMDREQAKRDREYDRADREAAKKPKIDLKAVYSKVIDVIGNVFPDGDPIDHLIPALRRMGVDQYDVGDTINAAMKKHGHGREKQGMYVYMADMWDDMAADAMHDAKNGDAREPFVRIEDGKPVKQSNPWK